ncbi:zinc finger BED domain-containing protein RICESLEEPER 2-like [Rosa chinensis]|uniref:zinc finger BED domain-containing protein RICESLEEPER 2-like n=1 Tax=Rosa chinensis TaxID=74649 RepID=UPI000D08AB5A|nr:zinc finger BED domain-containing protein RICESLEEPER 2-like [Rosa chinensis]
MVMLERWRINISPPIPITSIENSTIAAPPTENQENSTPTGTNELTNVNRPGFMRAPKSVVWDHFEKQVIGGKRKAACNHCKKQLISEKNSGTTHLHDHIKSCLYKKQRTIDQSMLHPTKSSDGSTKLGTYSFNPDNARKELGHMIILHEYPLSIVDHVGFRRYSFELQPLFLVPTRNTIKKDIFKIFEVEREKTMKLLDSNRSRIAITTDMWTSSNQKRGFMTITSHFIDDSWNLQNRLLRFIYVPCPHTAEVLADALVNCLFEWNLDRKLSTLTVDNCTTNDAMIDKILGKIDSSSLLLDGDLFHMRCCAHILNLVVRDGLDVIKDSVEKIRYSVAFWTATPNREEKFVEAAKQLRIPSTKKLELDCKTRWNSTYTMLNTAMIYEDVFPRLKHRDALYKFSPSEDDWSKTKEIIDKLEMFYDATELFSAPTPPIWHYSSFGFAR